jgi:hypothetical protein
VDPSLFVALVLVGAGWLAIEFGVSTAITEILAGVLLAGVIDVAPLFSAVLLIVLASALLPMLALRDLPTELDG